MAELSGIYLICHRLHQLVILLYDRYDLISCSVRGNRILFCCCCKLGCSFISCCILKHRFLYKFQGRRARDFIGLLVLFMPIHIIGRYTCE